MKARVRMPDPLVLTWGIPASVQEPLGQLFQELNLPLRQVQDQEMGQTVGYLAGFPGFSFQESGEVPQDIPELGVLCMCALQSGQVDRLLQGLRQKGISVPLKAVVTPTNQKWTFAQLVRELQREHEAFARKGEP